MNSSTVLVGYSVVVTLVAVLMTYNTVQLIGTNEVSVIGRDCVMVEDKIRDMSTDDMNSLMIVIAETLTDNYKEETREQVEKEHEAYANRLALEHMNDVMGVLIKSIGAMPTSTIEK